MHTVVTSNQTSLYSMGGGINVPSFCRKIKHNFWAKGQILTRVLQILCIIFIFNWVIYLSGKVTYRTWRNLLNKKIDDSHNCIIPFVSRRGKLINYGEWGEGLGVPKVEFYQGLKNEAYSEVRFGDCSIKKIGFANNVQRKNHWIMDFYKEHLMKCENSLRLKVWG